MRTIKIPNCEYVKYELIRDSLIKHIPFALINDMYSKGTKTAVFNFWDSDYIPKCLRLFIIRPPQHKETVNTVNDLLLDLFNGELI